MPLMARESYAPMLPSYGGRAAVARVDIATDAMLMPGSSMIRRHDAAITTKIRRRARAR